MPRRLQEEIRQTRPFRNVAQEAALALLRTTDLLRRVATARLTPHDLTLQQYNVLRILRGAQGPLPTLEIAERMLEQAPGITRLIDRLEAKHLVARVPCKTDRRQVHCHITPSGLELLTVLDPEIDEADGLLERVLSADQLAQLVALLAVARDALAADLATLTETKTHAQP
ncbi:MAG: MarR family transcriptional regulator [Gemmatimonadaceae bacterium]|jgi:DNA-binding MarR family transcriptional regulator|nr:MarR family transcriptional regulator [Gemmatimonadaceae bacterium]